MSVAKQAALRGVAIAKTLEEWLPRLEESESDAFQSAFIPALDSVKQMPKKELRVLEQEVAGGLKEKGELEEVQDLLAFDMNYETAGLSTRRYRSRPETYLLIREAVRAEVLEDGVLSTECICLLWLFRETGVLHDIFTVSVQEKVHAKLTLHAAKQAVIAELLNAEVHRVGEIFGIKYLKFKKELFHNPYLQGINLMFPFLERRQTIFVDFVVLGTDVSGRRQKVISYLQERGHYVDEYKYQEETLLKIDNAYYRIFPTTRWAKFPITGRKCGKNPLYKRAAP